MPKPTVTVAQIHFEDLDGKNFERLVYAYHYRSESWSSLEWYGETGSDLGRDIWGVQTLGSKSKTICIQCVNRKRLTLSKVSSDLQKVLNAPNGKPDCFRIVARTSISAELRDSVKKEVYKAGIKECDQWSGPEFEEKLRSNAEPLLRRFFDGEIFPDDSVTLRACVSGTDADIVTAMHSLFSRPAFYTPIHQESNLGDFRQAISDTIQALGTGIARTRDGEVIKRIASRHQLQDEKTRKDLEKVEVALSKLRARFDEMTRTGELKHCGCSQPTCPTYFFKDSSKANELEHLREYALNAFRAASPKFVGPHW